MLYYDEKQHVDEEEREESTTLNVGWRLGRIFVAPENIKKRVTSVLKTAITDVTDKASSVVQQQSHVTCARKISEAWVIEMHHTCCVSVFQLPFIKKELGYLDF